MRLLPSGLVATLLVACGGGDVEVEAGAVPQPTTGGETAWAKKVAPEPEDAAPEAAPDPSVPSSGAAPPPK